MRKTLIREAKCIAFKFHRPDRVSDITYAGSATWEDTTIAALGFAPASYEIRWDSGNQGINITVVPEPSAYAALASLFALGVVGCRRKFKA
ncbi:MAG: hypothetical protein CML13_07215 [Puniceicoccaceae bacterium]|nr:hypothetical protein [Puniceicoccaceae bacterium]